MNAADPTPSAADRRAAWLAACLLVAVAGFYLVRGMPWANVDDVFFTGGAMGLAQTGQLVNHPVDGWLATFGTQRFFVHLPFHTYTLAGWIRLFGANTVSFQWFEWVCYLIGGLGLVRMLGRFGLPLASRLLLAIIYLTILIRTGFRPEAEAFGLLFLGLSLLEANASFGRKTAALLLLGLSVLTYPLTVALAPPFVVALLTLQRPPGTSARAWLGGVARSWVVPLALAVGIVKLTLLAMIHFEFTEFWKIFSVHRHSRALPEGTAAAFIKLLTEYSEAVLNLPVVLLLAAAAMFVAARWRHVEPRVRALVLACAAAGALCVVLYVARALEWMLLLSFCAGFALASDTGMRRWRWTAVALLAGLCAWTQTLWIVNASLRQFPDPAVWRAAREAALRSGKKLVVDGSTARYVFDFQLPEGTRDMVFFKPWSAEHPLTLADKKEDAYWIVSAPLLYLWTADLPERYHNFPRMRIGGHTFQSLPLRPDEPLVIP